MQAKQKVKIKSLKKKEKSLVQCVVKKITPTFHLHPIPSIKC